jgi:hypothetical protein
VVLSGFIAGRGGAATAAPDGTSGPPTSLERVTVLGSTRVKELTLASEVLFAAPVTAERRQAGCVRFSFVPVASATPRRYHCQPDLEVSVEIDSAERRAAAGGGTLSNADRAAITQAVQGWLVPSFSRTQYGSPEYAQLHLTCPVQIRTGAEDGSEMGAFCHLKQPQREANLRLRLQEYLPFGLEPGIIYVT